MLMDYLYAPWRSSYVRQEHGKQETTSSEECVFCACIQKSDADCYILHRATSWFVILNRFPYNAGHLLIVSYSHTSLFTSLERAAQHELIDLTHASMKIINKTVAPDGMNMGMNIGKGAGAGIPSHIHQHIVPRWFGDTNFLPVLSETKHISCDLNEIYRVLQAAFREYYKQ